MSGYKPTMITLGLLPTPKTSDIAAGRKTIAGTQGNFIRINKDNTKRMGANLAGVVGMLPIPNASDNRDRGGPKDPAIKRRLEMGKQVGLTMMVDGQLNPRFVMEMMGFPSDWTLLPFLSGDKNQ
jgi:hypothetical protein